jgi:hypothetical protein
MEDKLSPADVVYSLKRLQDPAIASPGSWVLDDVLDIHESMCGYCDSLSFSSQCLVLVPFGHAVLRGDARRG